jgi:hypothetical protein
MAWPGLLLSRFGLQQPEWALPVAMTVSRTSPLFILELPKAY